MDSKKLESNLVNMVTVLTVIAIVSSSLLGFTYLKTKDAIAAVQLKKKVEAIKAVTPAFDSNPDDNKFTAQGIEFYPVSKGGENVGVAIKTFSSKGFSGNVSIMVGLDNQGNIYNTAVLQHAETPGLGSKMESDKFKKQFVGKSPQTFKLSVKKDGGDVDAITAATISSRAFCDALQKACTTYQKEKSSSQVDKS